MYKEELVKKMAEKSGLSKKDSEAGLNAIIQVIEKALSKKEKVLLVGFGTFQVRNRAKRKGINPITKETITIPAKKAPLFTAGKALKEAVNKKKSKK
jgi:DNA-binding protein HU-beta